MVSNSMILYGFVPGEGLRLLTKSSEERLSQPTILEKIDLVTTIIFSDMRIGLPLLAATGTVSCGFSIVLLSAAVVLYPTAPLLFLACAACGIAMFALSMLCTSTTFGTLLSKGVSYLLD